jgi:hypothetical protein
MSKLEVKHRRLHLNIHYTKEGVQEINWNKFTDAFDRPFQKVALCLNLNELSFLAIFFRMRFPLVWAAQITQV